MNVSKKKEKEWVIGAYEKVNRTLWILYQVQVLGWNDKCLQICQMAMISLIHVLLLSLRAGLVTLLVYYSSLHIHRFESPSSPHLYPIKSYRPFYPLLFYSYLILSYPIMPSPLLPHSGLSYPIPVDWILFNYDAWLLVSSLRLILPVSVTKSVQSVFAVRVGRTHTGNHTSSRSLAWQRKRRESVEERKSKKCWRKEERQSTRKKERGRNIVIDRRMHR